MLRLIDKLISKSESNKLFIVPTINGLKFLAVNLILIVLGMIYANNFLIFISFVMFTFLLLAMFYSHFNLHGLFIEEIDIPPFHADENQVLRIFFKTTVVNQRSSLKLYFKSHQGLYKSDSFYLNPDTNLATTQILGINRGITTINKVLLSGTFPLGLFVSFIFFDLNSELVIYPAKKKTSVIQDSIKQNTLSETEYFNIREYITGDKINSIMWKKYAPDLILVKENTTGTKTQLFLNLDQIHDEEKLSGVIYFVHWAFENDYHLSIDSKGKKYLINHPSNLNVFLKDMATYEV